MGFQKKTYDKAMGVLNDRRITALRQAEERRKELVSKCPEVGELEQKISMAGLQAVKAVLANPDSVEAAMEKIQNENLLYQKQLTELLGRLSLPADFLEPHYSCPACRDEGFIDGKMCDCLRELMRKINCDELNRLSPLQLSDLESFSLSFYDDSYDEALKGSPRQQMKRVLHYCTDYAAHFSLKSGNLLMMGASGLGKTHLSLSIAKEVIEKGFSVVYGSVQNLMTQLEREKFGRAEPGEESGQEIMHCDLLILDDLGTEFTTSFVTSAIYNIINTRLLSGKPTIISTNLTLKELVDHYSERVMSRLIGSYQVLGFVGRDIRQLKNKIPGGIRKHE